MDKAEGDNRQTGQDQQTAERGERRSWERDRQTKRQTNKELDRQRDRQPGTSRQARGSRQGHRCGTSRAGHREALSLSVPVSQGLCWHVSLRISGAFCSLRPQLSFPGNFCSLRASPCPVLVPLVSLSMVSSQRPRSRATSLTCPSCTVSGRSDTSCGSGEAPIGTGPSSGGGQEGQGLRLWGQLLGLLNRKGSTEPCPHIWPARANAAGGAPAGRGRQGG